MLEQMFKPAQLARNYTMPAAVLAPFTTRLGFRFLW